MRTSDKERNDKTATIGRFNEFEKKLHPVLRVLITLAVMGLLAFVIDKAGVPNPNMIMVSGLVIFASLFGMYGGITAAVIMSVFTLYFFSTNHNFVTFDSVNIQKVVVSAVGIVIITLFVSFLKNTENKAFERMEYLTQLLKKDNELLEEATLTDPLTNIRNRFSLRRDYAGYEKQDLHVMMMDLDNFKNINDSYGHDTGDYILAEFARVLGELYGSDHSYRYGGDEFLVILPNVSEEEFRKKNEQAVQKIREISLQNSDVRAAFTGGYVYGMAEETGDLRTMMKKADDILLKAKQLGKNRILGEKYDRFQIDKTSALDIVDSDSNM